MYKNARYRSQFLTDFHSIHMVGVGLLMRKPYCLCLSNRNNYKCYILHVTNTSISITLR